MIKQQYIQTKTTNPLKVIYEYYKDRFDSKKHRPLLSENEFYHYIQISSNINEIAVKVFNYYDRQFNVTTLLDRDGNIISFF